MSDTNRVKFFIKEIEDYYVQENFLKLKRYLDCVNLTGGDTTIINPGGGGSSTDPVWERFSATVAASTTLVVDTLPMANFMSLEYYVTFKDQVTDEVKGLKLKVVNNAGALRDMVSEKNGAAISLEVNTAVNGTDYELRIVNNTLNGLDVEYARLTLN